MIASDYFCEHCNSPQEHTVPSPSPDWVSCEFCGKQARWDPSPIAGHVRRVEVVRGKWERPERRTFLDTRKLGEGQDIEEFRSERRKIWNEERHRRVKELLR